MAWQDFFQKSGGEKINDALNTTYSNAKATLTTRDGFNKALDNIAGQLSDPMGAAMSFGPMAMGTIKPRPSEVIDDYYRAVSRPDHKTSGFTQRKALQQLEDAEKYGTNPYDDNKLSMEFKLKNAIDRAGEGGALAHLTNVANNVYMPEELLAARLHQSGALRNLQLSPAVEKEIKGWISSLVDTTPKPKKPLPGE